MKNVTRSCTEKDRRPLVLLAFGGLILATGFLGHFFPRPAAGTFFTVQHQPSGKVELVRTSLPAKHKVSGELVLSSSLNCIDTPPRYAFFFDLPLPVNRADFFSLTMLPGIGPKMAGALLRFRKEQGRFARAEDLVQVRGVGTGLATRLQPMLCFE